MTLGVPAEVSWYRDAPTVPLAGETSNGPAQHPGGPQTPPMGTRSETGRRHRLPRWLRRFLVVALALAIAVTLAFVALLLATPSVSNAPALAHAYDRAHHAAYPGPLVPARFATALVATEDHRFYSEP